MAGELKLAFVINAIDNATKKVKAVNDAVAKSREPYQKVRAAAREFFQEAGWGKLQNQMGAIRERGAALMGTVRGIATALGLAGVAAGGAFLGLKRVADEVDRINDTAASLGMTTQRFQQMGYAAQLSGSSSEEMAQSLVFLNKNMGEARSGSKEALESFARVGITMADLQNPAFTAGDAFERIADKFNQVGDAGNNAGKKIEVTTALLGRSGFRQIQFLNGGSAAMRRFYEEADRLGVTLSDETIRNMGAFNDSFDRLRMTVFGAIANALGPAAPRLQALVERMVAWTAANRSLIATRVGTFIDRMLQLLPPFLEAVIQIARWTAALAVGADRFAQALGGWGNVLTIIGVLLATKVVVGIVALGASIAGALPTIITLAKWIAPMVTGLVAFVGLPGLLVAGIVAAGVAVLAYWRPIAEFFSDLWDTIAGVSGASRSRRAEIAAGGVGLAESSAFRAASALPGGGAAKLGGTLDIRINSDGRPQVTNLRKDEGSVLEFQAYTGRPMVLN